MTTVKIHSSDSIDAMDRADPLRGYRERYVLPEGLIYLDGNSLGPASRKALSALSVAGNEEWAEGLIRSWNTAGWFSLPLELGDKIGRLVGAAPGQVAVTDSITVNLFKLLHAALSLRPGRNVIVAEAGSFPTDLYIAEGVASTANGIQIKLEGIDGPSLDSLIDGDTAVVLVNHVDYRTGILRDMKSLTKTIHQSGALALWDLSHSAGALPVMLDEAGADLAVGCTYKYINGGPGAPAYLYAAKRHHGQLKQPLTGWWGHARPFDFETGYTPAQGMRAFLTGTQPILSFRTLAGALEDWADVDMSEVRRKSLALTGLFTDLVEERCGGLGLEVNTPRESGLRGSQVALRHANAFPVMQALINRGVIGDFRAPDVLRFGFTPLYLRYRDVFDAVEILHDILETGSWKDPQFAHRSAVT